MQRGLQLKLIVSLAFLTATLFFTSLVIVRGQYAFLLLLIPLLFYQLRRMLHTQKRVHLELNNFIEAVQYKDFSRHFSTKKVPREIRDMRKGFNEITDAFRNISKEKETQYQYLQKILEMVNTGILSFHATSGEVMWMNESLKKLLQLPYLKHLDSLEKRYAALHTDIAGLRPGDTKISTLQIGLETYKVLLSATAFQTHEDRFILIGFQNISKAVDETESEAWRKLLRVLTHEIMNSVAPIASLATTLNDRLTERASAGAALPEDIQVGMSTIKSRSEGLLKFAQTYRSLNKIAAPDRKWFYVCDLFENIYNLMAPTLEKKGIELEIVLKDTTLEVYADMGLIEQVLINLVLNARDAARDVPGKQIVLSATHQSGNILIRVADNGMGMEKEILDKIFVPFFSTKKTGSGIGLSLSKQIMRAHSGNLHVSSEPGRGSVFTLHFDQANQEG